MSGIHKSQTARLINERFFLLAFDMKKNKLSVTYRKTEELIPYVNNARTHSEEQVVQIASSIKEFGFNNPILVDGENGVIAGHGRLMAAKKLGLDEVPTIELAELTETQKKAYILADNKIALNSGWDEELLKLEVEQLQAEGVNLEVVGFDEEDLDSLLDTACESLEDEAEELEPPPQDPKTEQGDVWIMGGIV